MWSDVFPQEIKAILAVVVQRNGINEAAYSQQLLFASWSQLVEVTLHALAGGGGEREEPGRVAVLFDLIQDLLLKVNVCFCEIKYVMFTGFFKHKKYFLRRMNYFMVLVTYFYNGCLSREFVSVDFDSFKNRCNK